MSVHLPIANGTQEDLRQNNQAVGGQNVDPTQAQGTLSTLADTVENTLPLADTLVDSTWRRTVPNTVPVSGTFPDTIPDTVPQISMEGMIIWILLSKTIFLLIKKRMSRPRNLTRPHLLG